MAKKMNLRALALAPNAGFRSKLITVPEWDDVTVTLREPSAGAWGLWQDIISPKEGEEDGTLSIAEKTHRNIRGDVVLFIDVLRDKNGDPVFTNEDIDTVAGIYGPVHSRLLQQALELMVSQADAEKKSKTPPPSS
ncbi:phage tail assembly chaperone [Xenorhabdus griffiniae]|uniref:Phage tail assembly chaperone n=1 Tax=Xenorhabdus griffiniae TaxID=351672 RepID=A0ABY9XDF8_9GAMM|nr:phage tail assembly chaperone [Xenorhabdus griffiniae]MBD1229131.1 phage tail protein [Xenorhabdus griffiniae]MBE8588938.1 phage tail protein [Xenorhabdus griffiniae]WMV70957.1 phage tail assembly chaperone [Xenorhabdus griffiniae]WMV71656.1 phage tail assembly chaperone [Xenorhabdus griffiniae]WNH00633.1 phage tail assembly chaperone [Xenorhabdus griffiniae]